MNTTELEELVSKLETYYKSDEFIFSDGGLFIKGNLQTDNNNGPYFREKYILINFGFAFGFELPSYYFKVNYKENFGHQFNLIIETQLNTGTRIEDFPISELLSTRMKYILVELYSLAFNDIK